MIFVTIDHPERSDIRAILVAEVSEDLPHLQHLYLETKSNKGWKRSRKIKRGFFDKYMKRFGFDAIEAGFLLEEAAQNQEEED